MTQFDSIDQLTGQLDEVIAQLHGLAGAGGSRQAGRRSRFQLDSRESLEDVAASALQQIVKSTPFSMGLLHVVEAGRLVLKGHCGHRPDVLADSGPLPLGQGIAGRVALTGDPVFVENLSVDPRVFNASAKRAGMKAYLCAPLRIGAEVQGTLTLTSWGSVELDPEMADYVYGIADYFAVIVENHRLRCMVSTLDLASVAQARAAIAETIRRADMEAYGETTTLSGNSASRLRSTAALTAGISRVPEGPAQVILESWIREQALFAERALDIRFDISAPGSTEVSPLVAHHLWIALCLGAAAGTDPGDRVDVTVRDAGSRVNVRLETPKSARRMEGIGAQLQARAVLADVPMALGAPGEKASIELSLEKVREPKSPSSPVPVVLVIRAGLFRHAVATTLAMSPRTQIVAVAATSEEAAGLLWREPNAVVVIAGHESDSALVKAISQFTEGEANRPVVAILEPSAHASEVFAAVGGRVISYLDSTCTNSELVDAVIAASEGERQVSPSIARCLLDLLPGASDQPADLVAHDLLTNREREILALLARGWNSKRVAQSLSISDKTVRNHVSNIYRKLEIYDRVEMILYANRSGLL